MKLPYHSPYPQRYTEQNDVNDNNLLYETKVSCYNYVVFTGLSC